MRLIIRKIEDFDTKFKNQKKTINLFLQSNLDTKVLKSLISESDEVGDKLFLYLNKNGKLLSFDLSSKYKVKSFNYLDQLSEAKILDYSIESS